MSTQKSISFDVLGTCFSFSHAIETIEARLGPKLQRVNVDSKSFFFSWFYAAQRDFTYCSMVGHYVPIAQILIKTFRRAALIVDLPAGDVSDEDIEAIMQAVKTLKAQPGLKNCYDGLRDLNWDVYGVTNGSLQTSLSYYAQAKIDLEPDHLLSCDELQCAKPDLEVYENAKRVVGRAGCTAEGDRWFVAAHAWDLIAARKAGFKTAYLALEEHDPVTDVFGKFDVYAEGFDELLAKLSAVV